MELGRKFGLSLTTVEPPPPTNIVVLKEIAYRYEPDDLEAALEETQ